MIDKHLHWFALANAAHYDLKQTFYAFKKRFLARHGEREGYDLQHIRQVCHSCGGSGRYFDLGDCRRCDGTGTYAWKEIWLERWILGGRLFHIPADGIVDDRNNLSPREEIEGRILHPSVADVVGRRAFARLLLRHEPLNFWKYFGEPAYRTGTPHIAYRRRHLIDLRNREELFPFFENKTVDMGHCSNHALP